MAALLACGVFSQVLVAGRAHVEDGQAGIAYLTEELYAQAISCGRSGSECAVTRYQLCPGEITQNAASIATPFSRVAYSVYDKVSRRQRARPMERGPANVWGLGIYVSPSKNHAAADSIRRVVLKRDGRIIEPTATTIAPIPGVAEGEAKPLVRGFFAFPMETLSPGSEVTVILTGSQGDVSCALGREKLMTLQ